MWASQGRLVERVRKRTEERESSFGERSEQFFCTYLKSDRHSHADRSKNTSNALAVNPPTLNSATTTTTISPSPATSARTAAATGPRAALSATFLWVAAAARTPSAPPTPNALLLLPLRRRCLLRRCRPLQTLLLRSPSPPESTLRRRTRTEECSTSAEVSALSWLERPIRKLVGESESDRVGSWGAVECIFRDAEFGFGSNSGNGVAEQRQFRELFGYPNWRFKLLEWRQWLA
ncbi:hypothetical protein CK203_068029 [Vitis vinifera]|uniref:Uncharacterized protein n=1 Tax=Vitis vinifera TaxID=29760 RepID=A0A438EW25_VITVI|nr:hypothetical protein CK203_068029 [Vitis vinifera]